MKTTGYMRLIFVGKYKVILYDFCLFFFFHKKKHIMHLILIGYFHIGYTSSFYIHYQYKGAIILFISC